MFQRFDRMIPKDGITVYPEVVYLDVNDISKEEREKATTFIYTDSTYYRLHRQGSEIFKGIVNDRSFCVYIYRRKELVGVITLREKLDNKDGYGKDDFLFNKYIWPEYQHTKYSRYLSGDLIHLVFKSGLANNLYAYMPATQKDVKFYWDKISKDLPCVGIRYETDGPLVQKYIKVVKEFQTKYGPYILVEFSGDIYRSMSIVDYFMSSPGQKCDVVNKWLLQLDEAADKVRIEQLREELAWG